MKHVKKGSPPQELKDWVRANYNVPDAEFGTHGFPKKETKDALLKEQGNLCPYTMIPLDKSNSHIEHIKPQEESRVSKTLSETWDYNNMLACYPSNDSDAPGRHDFGSLKKDNHWDEAKFLSPLTPSCESRLRFSMDGTVCARNTGDTEATWTIALLGLQEKILEELRRATIDTLGVSATAEARLSRPQAERLIKDIQKRRSDGSFHGYCVAVEHAAKEYIALLDKQEKKRKYAVKDRSAKGK